MMLYIRRGNNYMNVFRKYPSIENSYQEEYITKVKLYGYDNVRYCITEKIHGSNTQIIYEPATKTFTYAKRTAVIEPDEKCYNVEKCFENIKDAVEELYVYLKPTVEGTIETVHVYGEVFGGIYPHSLVKKDTKATKVQKGVFYSPHNEWLAFDISYTLEGDERNYFLSGEDFYHACNAVGLDTVPLLKVVDSLDEALEYPNNGESVVYDKFNLPKIADNIMEGVVIKPWHRDLWMGQSRVVIKNKSEKYKERSHEKKPELTIEYSDNVKAALTEAATFVTENRVNNVMSHEGEISVKDVGKIIGLTAKDAVEDFIKNSKYWSLLEKVEEKIVTKQIQRWVADLVRKTILGA